MVGGLWTWRSPTVTLVRLKLALDRHDLAGVESAVDFDALTGAALSGLLEDRAGDSETVRLALRGKGGWLPSMASARDYLKIRLQRTVERMVEEPTAMLRVSWANLRQAIATLRREGAPSPSLTRDYLTGTKSIPIPKSRRRCSSSVKITGAREHNLKNIDVALPLGVFTCVTGVSGSGKSTLVHDVLYRNLVRAKGQSSDQEPGICKSVTGADRIGDVVMVDQAPLARTPRSTPILYLGLFDRLRELFAAQPEAMAQGLTASAFSFNSGTGRCERCSGTGYEKIEMQFLSDLFVRCAECEGKRFQSHVLKVRLHNRSIDDVLKLTVSEAIQFFAHISDQTIAPVPVERATEISDGLKVLEEVGLGYLRLGQPLSALSGGESQRLKLVGHLAEAKNAQRSTPKAFASRPPNAQRRRKDGP